MATWLWILILVLVLLMLFGGIGVYRGRQRFSLTRIFGFGGRGGRSAVLSWR